MTGWAVFFALLGAASAVGQVMRVVDFLERR